MPDSNFRFSISISVRFDDMDALGHVNNAKYLTYFEEARLAYWVNLFPLDYSNIQSVGLILASADVNFRAPAQLGDVLTVYVRVPEFGTKSFPMEYRIEHQKTGQLVADGSTVQVMYDYERKLTIPVPADTKKRITEFESA
ncbi:MAG: thioesterase family protein [bacterium]